MYPVQIENYLSKHEAVKDVAVIGLKDDRLGEIAAAIIELVPGAVCTEDEMNEFCKGLPRYKRPRKISLQMYRETQPVKLRNQNCARCIRVKTW